MKSRDVVKMYNRRFHSLENILGLLDIITAFLLSHDYHAKILSFHETML